MCLRSASSKSHLGDAAGISSVEHAPVPCELDALLAGVQLGQPLAEHALVHRDDCTRRTHAARTPVARCMEAAASRAAAAAAAAAGWQRGARHARLLERERCWCRGRAAGERGAAARGEQASRRPGPWAANPTVHAHPRLSDCLQPLQRQRQCAQHRLATKVDVQAGLPSEPRSLALCCGEQHDGSVDESSAQPGAARPCKRAGAACRAQERLDIVLALCASCRHPAARPWPSRLKAPLARSLLAAPMPLHALAQAPCAWAPPSTSCSGRPAPAAALPPRRLGQRRQTAAAAGAGKGQPHPEESERPQGDSKLQDSLVNQLQFEIGKKRVRGRRHCPPPIRCCAGCCGAAPAACPSAAVHAA